MLAVLLVHVFRTTHTTLAFICLSLTVCLSVSLSHAVYLPLLARSLSSSACLSVSPCLQDNMDRGPLYYQGYLPKLSPSGLPVISEIADFSEK